MRRRVTLPPVYPPREPRGADGEIVTVRLARGVRAEIEERRRREAQERPVPEDHPRDGTLTEVKPPEGLPAHPIPAVRPDFPQDGEVQPVELSPASRAVVEAARQSEARTDPPRRDTGEPVATPRGFSEGAPLPPVAPAEDRPPDGRVTVIR